MLLLLAWWSQRSIGSGDPTLIHIGSLDLSLFEKFLQCLSALLLQRLLKKFGGFIKVFILVSSTAVRVRLRDKVFSLLLLSLLVFHLAGN